MNVRKPKIDWSAGFERHWNGGNPVATHAFNSNSFLFPQGERFFIRAVREVVAFPEFHPDAGLAREVKDFIAQESIHTLHHEQYNAELKRQGYVNHAEPIIEYLDRQAERTLSPLGRLAVVCAYEHYTAILGHFVLSNPAVLEAAQPQMALVWGWHAAEETEHKSVCFDVYQAAGGGWLRRVALFIVVSFNFTFMFNRLFFSMLYRDGCFRPRKIFRTLAQIASFFLGPRGVNWYLLFNGLRYISPRFHPWKQNNRQALAEWLAQNNERLIVLDAAQ